MPAKENYPGYLSTGDRGIHGLLRESGSSDILLYRLDPEVLLSDSLVILKANSAVLERFHRNVRLCKNYFFIMSEYPN
jgi:hypothetical protein